MKHRNDFLHWFFLSLSANAVLFRKFISPWANLLPVNLRVGGGEGSQRERGIKFLQCKARSIKKGHITQHALPARSFNGGLHQVRFNPVTRFPARP